MHTLGGSTPKSGLLAGSMNWPDLQGRSKQKMGSTPSDQDNSTIKIMLHTVHRYPSSEMPWQLATVLHPEPTQIWDPNLRAPMSQLINSNLM